MVDDLSTELSATTIPGGGFEYERRFFCRELPDAICSDGQPTLIVQSYYVHSDNYALRVRVKSNSLNLAMTPDLDARAVLREYRDAFRSATVTVKGPSVGGTRYEAEQQIDARYGVELILRGGDVLIKNRITVWVGEDGWHLDVFGGTNAPLIIAEAERSTPVTNLVIPRFCITEITDQRRFSNDDLSWQPFATWSAEFEHELATEGPQFQQMFGRNRFEDE
ncbi:hypothetical protein [Bifidobacterium gallicum]|uniref:Adenylate cyclase n=1 Tax=Bifidobacterium gallicum DSM 20093 = LMG 11596 TaxID=561180 RepID=D1NWP1_9BIFI|nr:hypothetical protein [Bifidobacterium gallicum]EFA22200.1 hypothetical protein BIFGAL_04296 [Bifidobacterium gallicum DSM 20093 = LMG 11596]KFI59064.1 adenylate cyclase [Bifidobacterium gallicum DSM 20093 = LMG 11596]